MRLNKQTQEFYFQCFSVESALHTRSFVIYNVNTSLSFLFWAYCLTFAAATDAQDVPLNFRAQFSPNFPL